MNLRITSDDIRAELDRRRYNKLQTMFATPEMREGYSKHISLIEATKDYRSVSMIAGNRVGKTEVGAFIIACHLTGLYPDWWRGKKFSGPVSIIVAGETGRLVRDSVQDKLMGPINDIGSGYIPKNRIIDKTSKMGIPDAIDTVTVGNVSGTSSLLVFQSYDQGREKFQATARHVIWCDEEPPLEIYVEMILRTMTTNGYVLSTFTPLKGMSNTIMYLQEQAESNQAKIITATWDDAPHLSEAVKAEMLAQLPPHQRDARSKGVPALGSGVVYPISDVDYVVQPFAIPPHYKHVYGMDVGWNNTASIWLAQDPDTDTIYAYAEYKRGQAEPVLHSTAIKAKGDWIPGVIDPASKGRSQRDGDQLILEYRQHGLDIIAADNAVEAGIFAVYDALTTGRLKIFNNLTETLKEMRLYRRDDRGKIVKENDHLMDCLRYAIKSGLTRAKQNTITNKAKSFKRGSGASWMGV